jgi:Phospholipase_D-nuclease N-terminal
MAAGLPPGTATAIAVLVVAVGIAVYSLVDLARAKQVRYLEKPWWALIICLTIPWGGLAYLIFGKVR